VKNENSDSITMDETPIVFQNPEQEKEELNQDNQIDIKDLGFVLKNIEYENNEINDASIEED